MIKTQAAAPKALLWDWDGTLADSWNLIYACLQETFLKMGLTPWKEEEARKHSHAPMQETFPALFGEHWEAAGKMYREAYRARHLECLALMPGAERTLKLAAERGFYQAVVSNKLGESLRKEVKHAGLEPFFAKVIGSKDAGRDKPFPDPARMAAELHAERGAEVWLIGDTATDLRCAHACGFTPVLIGGTDFIAPEDLAAFPPAFHVNDHEELSALLAKHG